MDTTTIQAMLTDASTVTMYAVGYYDYLTYTHYWYNFDLGEWGTRITHTLDNLLAQAAATTVDNGMIVAVDVQATNARFI